MMDTWRNLSTPGRLQLRLGEKRGRMAGAGGGVDVESTAAGDTRRRSNCFGFSPLFSFSFEPSQSSHLR